MGLFDRFRNDPESTTEYDEPKEREETRTMDVTRGFKVYRIYIDYGDSTRTEYVTKYTDGTHTMKLYDQEPYITAQYNVSSAFSNIQSHYLPSIGLRDGEPLIISLANVEDVDISVDGEYVFVCEDVEYTQFLQQHEEGGEWEEFYRDFTKAKDDYDISEWLKVEWEASREA